MFPWQSALTGVESCPLSAGYGRDREIHIGSDIARAVWQYYTQTLDLVWLKTVGWPLLNGIATFWMSKIKLDNSHPSSPSGPLHILNVVGPDEYHDHTNNSAYTSAGAVLTLRSASKAAQLLGMASVVHSEWDDAAARLVVPYTATAPGFAGGLRPEYDGMPFGQKVKQADTILLDYPLGFKDARSSAALTANDLNYYALHTDEQGPAMTWAMFAVGYVSLGPSYAGKAAANFNRSFANVHPPFGVWLETPSGGTPNFLTGTGGFIQTVYAGYPGLRINDTAFALAPQLPPGATSVKLRGVCWRGNRIDVEYNATGVHVTVRVGSSSSGAAEATQLPHQRYAREPWGLLLPAGPHTPAAAAASLSLMPTTTIAERSQRSRVVINTYTPTPWVMSAAALELVDATGLQHTLVPGVTLTLPRQGFAIVSKAQAR